MSMELELQALDELEAPMSNEFWTGFFAGAALTIACAAFVAT